MSNTSYDLVVLAAGMGRRFGGLKQVEPIGPGGEIILDYSVHDARRAGFGRAVLVIRRDIERDFRAAIGRRLEGRMDVAYVFQELDDLPPPHKPAPGRGKPWGTGHAVLAAEPVVRGPFAVINADDFYGASAYRELVRFFGTPARTAGGRPAYGLVGYPLSQTLSDNGTVNRGVCTADAAGHLTGIREVLTIERLPDGRARYPAGPGDWRVLSGDERVSMTFFGFTPAFFGQSRRLFAEFLSQHAGSETAELYLPEVVGRLIASGEAEVSLLASDDAWFGVTYRQDIPAVQAAIRRLIDQGVYPEKL